MTTRYPILFEAEATGAVSAYVADLPVYGAADTAEDAERDICDLLASCLSDRQAKGLPLPAPRTIVKVARISATALDRDVGEEHPARLGRRQLPFQPLALPARLDVLGGERADVLAAQPGRARADETDAFVHEAVVVGGLAAADEVLRERRPQGLPVLDGRLVVAGRHVHGQRKARQQRQEPLQVQVARNDEEVRTIVCRQGGDVVEDAHQAVCSGPQVLHTLGRIVIAVGVRRHAEAERLGLRGGGGRTHAVPHLERYHGTETFLTDALTNAAERRVADAAAERRTWSDWGCQRAPALRHPAAHEHPQGAGERGGDQQFRPGPLLRVLEEPKLAFGGQTDGRHDV